MVQTNEYTKSAWEKNTLIKDMVHGYIKIPKPIMREIVDSEQFQRLKDIEQTGMEALYPSATHKRFSHSLGVYHLAQKAFKAFQSNIFVSYPSIYGIIVHKYAKRCEQVWARWELLFQFAALLHDCGHSPFSHTLEFVYDLAGDRDGKELDKKLLEGMDDSFIRDFRSTKESHCGKAHERMSALYIKTDKYDGLRSKIEKLLKSYVQAYSLGNVYAKKNIMDDDIEFMIRMVIGCTYDYDSREDYKQKKLLYNDTTEKNWHIELQLRNCIIGMLNSRLDVDNLDYVVRDSKFSGYANHVVDLERLLSSFTIVRAFQVEDLEVTDICKFDYCINLKKFEGYKLEGRLTGECHILCEKKDIEAHGRIALKDSVDTTDEKLRVFHTRDDFSARLTFKGSRKAGELLKITVPRDSKDEFAYIHFIGTMSGKLTGIVFANDEASNQEGSIWCKNGKERIYFAYEQKCMSVLMSAIYNSNFEKKWIYAHHISTFTNNFLYIYLLEKYAEHVVAKKQKEMIDDFDIILKKVRTRAIGVSDREISEENHIKLLELKDNIQPREYDAQVYNKLEEANCDDLVITNNIIREIMQLCNALKDQGEDYSKKFYEILTKCCLSEDSLYCLTRKTVKAWNAVKKKHKGIVTTEMQIFSDILAMYEVYTVDGMAFYKTSDRDLLAAYKNLYTKINKQPNNTERERYGEFRECYEELSQRRYLKCLWKSQPEFEYYFSDWTEDEIRQLKELLSPAEAPKGYNYMVLSDNIDSSKMSEFEKEFWKHLKNEFKFERFVCVPQQIWTKKFVDRDTYMKRGYRVLRLKDIKLFNDDAQELDFFYFYYKQKEQTDVDVFEILKWLRKKIVEEKSNDHQR